MNWIYISMLLCTFGFFKEFRPSESFVTDYMTGPWKNFTATQVTQEIFPISTYSYLATLVVMFLITDLLRYKPIIILCSLSGAVTFTILILGKTILAMQVVEFFYGLFFSSEVAYYTYIYAKVDKEHYQKVTGHTKAATLIGRFMAGLVSQLTTSFNLLDYHQLNFLTLSAEVCATIWALFLPSVGQSIYFHRPISLTENKPMSSSRTSVTTEQHCVLDQHEFQLHTKESVPVQIPMFHKIKRAYILLWRDFLSAYTNSHIVKWSAWWAFATCGYLQVSTYIQLLWQTAVSPDDKIYNGLVDATYTIISALTVFCISMVPLNWPLLGEGVLSIFSFLEGILLIIASHSFNIWLMYAVYIGFGIIYHTMITVASFEVAKYISEDSYGLIFGINTLFSLLLQSLLTFVVVNGYITTNIRTQYTIYGEYFLALGFIFAVMAVFTIIRYIRTGGKINIILNNKCTESTIEVQVNNNEKSVDTDSAT